jgi:hypothetical protein
MSVSFGGFHNETATFKVKAEAEKGTPVIISENGTVQAAGDGDVFCGIIDNCDGSYASVQIYGEATAKYSGTAPALGYTNLAASGVGVKASETGREYLVLSVDSTAGTVTFLM